MIGIVYHRGFVHSVAHPFVKASIDLKGPYGIMTAACLDFMVYDGVYDTL